MARRFKSSKHRFVPYDQLDDSPNIIVDGAATTGTVLTLSHWPKSGTPADLKRDTSAEIVFAYLDSPVLYPNAEFVSNNHFDEDGLIGVFALTDQVTAQENRDLLMDVASAGDFGVYKQRDAARMAFAISTCADSNTSPLPKEIFEMPYPQMAGRLYENLLEVFPRLITSLNDYKNLWETEDAKLSASEELIENGDITIEERPELDLALINIPVGLPPMPAHRFTQVRLTECHPFALHSRTKCTRLFIAQGQRVEFQYRYESWVQLASRRPPARVDLKAMADELNREEISGGHWVFDGVDRITPRLHFKGNSATSISAGMFLSRLEKHLATGAPAWNPYDPGYSG
jgi:hypothetical protein